MPSSIAFPPMHAISLNNGGLVVIGVDGEIQILDSELEQPSEPVRPFPCTIELCCVENNVLFGCWLDRELFTARMAAINLESKLVEGVKREEVRCSLTSPNPIHVAGSNWSHILDAEPLAMAVSNGRVAFSIWKRGVYCIGTESEELWRAEQIPWTHALEDANIPIAMEWGESELLLWSRGGLWALLSADDGNLQSVGSLGTDVIVDRVVTNDDQRLLFDTTGRIFWLSGPLQEPDIRVLRTEGPPNSATWDSDISGWRICAWRDDVIWTEDTEKRTRRADIGVEIIRHNGQWLVLDNIGNWSTHMDE